MYVPSGAVPAAPRFAVDVPADWVAGASAGAMVMFQIADRPAWSVVVSSLRVGADTTLRDVAVRTFARQRQQHPDAQIRVQRTGRFGTRLTYLREVALPDDIPAPHRDPAGDIDDQARLQTVLKALDGLKEGERVVTRGNFKIDSALQIQAKPSMMSPKGGATPMHHQGQMQHQETKEQTLCPVMGGVINKEHFIEYEGKKVYFCCPGCEKEFLKEPEKYLDKLPQFK